MPTESIVKFLQYLGTTAGLGAAIALLMERVPGFQRLSKRAKATVIGALCIILPLGSWAALRFVPGEVFARWDPIFQQIVVGVSVLLAWLSSQAVHWADRRVPTSK
ncbi:MAG: hypothetical protein IT330_19160 [Anaerolineae bacterium]|nr:hypothetical protein [Anaerolineae bacterium]